MLCPACGVEQPLGNNFCEDCGSPMHATAAPTAANADQCAECGAGPDAIDTDGFCANCGHERIAPARDHVEVVPSPLLAAVSDRGLRHHRNEDAVALAGGSAGDVLVVCDGVSRSQNPDVASTTAATAACDVLQRARNGEARAAVAAALRAAREAVLALPVSKSDKEDPPETTIVAALRRGRKLSLGWVGDSRAYILGTNGARQLTVDHSWFNEVVAARQMTQEEALRSPLVHALTRTIGGPVGPSATGDEPTQCEVELPPGTGYLILCTDGLWNYLQGAEQLAGLLCVLPPEADAVTRARVLINFARNRGGHDNITAAVLKFMLMGDRT
jgi:PPM family protein phosphatase